MWCRIRLIMCCAALLLSPAVYAGQSALLIGVSDYEDATGIADLKGPANDVRLLQTALISRGIEDITVLADGVQNAVRPTRAAILDGLQDLAATAQSGDFILIHYSGHGTRQRDLNGDETDGFDEVILPADTRRAAPGTGIIANAITDDEIGAAVDAIRAKGANVWLVLDSCHSGTGLRAASPNVASRFVDPAALGVVGVPAFAPDESASDSDLPQGAGGVIAFYSAQSSELAREINVAGPDAPEAWYGLFTSRLAEQLQASPASSFRQLFQATLREMNDQTVPGTARLQTPLWEGDLIDALVFGSGETSGLRRFELRGDEVLAGKVHGVPAGTLLGLFANAADPEEAQIGTAQIEEALATRSFVRAVSASCLPSASMLCDADGALPQAARFAQVLARPIDLTITFAPPRDLSTGSPLPVSHPAHAALLRALSASASSAQLGTADSYDIDAVWDGTALWFGARAQVQDVPVGLKWIPGTTPLAPLLSRIERAANLSKLLGSLTGGSSLLNPSPVRIAATLSPVQITDLAPPDADISPRHECRAAQSRRAPDAHEPLSGPARLKQCDGLSISAIGAVPGARDVNRIHIDSQFCIHASYARIEDTVLASKLGPDMTICSDCPGGYSAGEEQMFVLVTEAAPGAPPLNLRGRVENCQPQAATRSAAGAAVAQFLETLGQGRATRGNMGAMGIADIWVTDFRWTVLPRQIALRSAGND